MHLILAGQKSFGVAVLERLLSEGYDVVYVSTHADDKLWWRAGTLRVPTRPGLDAAEVRDAGADLIVCAHSHSFVGRKSRGATRLGALVGHPSLLPRHRGKSAVEWTVRMNDPIAGFTWFWADDHVDTGPIAAQSWMHVVPGWTHNDLWERLFPLGIDLLVQTLSTIRDTRTITAVPQDERVATREPAIEPSNRLHRPELPAIGGQINGYEVIGSREDPRLRV